jgi:hypothetical protein
MIGDTSSGNTTYTTVDVTDGSAWDLSAVAVGDVAVTQDGYKGIITAVDDGNDNITVGYWQDNSGTRGTPQATTIKPTDGQTVTIHRIAQVRAIQVKALAANTDAIRLSLNGTAVATDFPLAAGLTILLFGGYLTADNVDVTDVFLLSDSGTQTVAWCVTSR